MNLRLHRCARVALAAALVSLAAFHVIDVFDRFRDKSEGGVFLAAQRGVFARLDWVSGVPYTVSPHGPGYMAPAHAMVHLIGGSFPMAGPRLLSLAAGLATAALIGFVVARQTRSLNVALACAGLYFLYPELSRWLNYARVDSLATLFAISAYVAAGTPTGLVGSVFLVVAGSVVKQTVALAALPIVAYCLLTGRSRQAVIFAGAVCLLGAAVWCWLFWISDGYYWTVGILGNRRAYSASQSWTLMKVLLWQPWTIAAAAALAAGWIVGTARSCRFAIALAFSWLVAPALVGFHGAQINYFLEAAALSSIVIGLYGLSMLQAATPRLMSVVLSVAGISVCLVFSLASWRAIRGPVAAPDFAPFGRTLASPSVLVDDAFVSAAIQSGLAPAVSDPFFLTVVAEGRRIDTQPLVRDLENGRVSGLILGRPLGTTGELSGWPAEIVPALRSHFTLVEQAGAAYLYRFDATATSSSATSARR